MRKKLFILLLVIGCVSPESYAQYEQEAHAFIEGLSSFAGNNKDFPVLLNDLQETYEEHNDKGLKNADPIQQALSKQRLSLPPGMAEDTEHLLRQKKNWELYENDPIFFPQHLSRKENATTVLCREGAKGIERSCIRKHFRWSSQEAITQEITLSVTSILIKGALLGIDLKNGTVSALQALDLEAIQYDSTEQIPFNLHVLFNSYPEFVTPTHLSVKVHTPLLELEAEQEATVMKMHFTAHSNSSPLLQYIVLEHPSVNNGYVAKIGFIHWNYIDFRFPYHHLGFDVSWQLTFPPKILPEEEGCEILIRNPLCKEIRTQPLEQKGAIVLSEEKHFICGAGTTTQQCAAIDKQHCEQIDSQCVSQEKGHCTEFKKTFSCGEKIALKKDLEAEQVADFLTSKNFVETAENYDVAEFGNALTQFNALKAINAPMKDNLGGIMGDPNNPSIFRGETKRCSIILGSGFKDCCQLEGIAQGLFGGCKEDERQLAVAEVKDKRCVKIGRYCAHKALGVCTEKKESYCCYGSQLAKILQEIAHQQLSLSWGDEENPQCASLTAAQLSQISFDTPFAKAKLSQLLNTYQATAQDTLKKAEVKGEQLQKEMEQRFASQKVMK